MTSTRRAIVCIAALAAAAPAFAQEPNTLSDAEREAGVVLLFDGTSLDGWATSGNKESWKIQDGQIVTSGQGGWWLRTTRMYRDFDLWLEFNIPPDGNSGVGLRGSSVGDPAFTGMEVQILDSFAKEPTITSCGAVYDAIAPSVNAVREPGQWNAYHIRLFGDRITVWLNDQKIIDNQPLDDRGYTHTEDRPNPLSARLPTGYIALQDHGNPVRFRSIKIRDYSPDPDPGGFEPIFNNTDLTGWTPRGLTKWTVEDGTLVGRNGPGHLFSDGVYRDFEMRAFVKINAHGNSGFYFRTVPNPDNPDSWPVGYEAQIDNHDPKNFTGSIYDKAWPKTGPITRDDAWFDYRVSAIGPLIQTWINGKLMTEAMLTDYSRGHIVLQGHHPGNVVMWRDIQVRDLAPVKPAPAASEP